MRINNQRLKSLFYRLKKTNKTETEGSQSKTTLVWTDLETGGLNGLLPDGRIGAQAYPIIEIALHLTDANLSPIGETLRLVVHHDEAVLNSMDEWAIEKHKSSGLWAESLASTLTLRDVELLCIDHLKANDAKPYNRKERSGCIMAGNSISFDKSYINAQMPEFDTYFHYRLFDISMMDLGCRLWNSSLNSDIHKQYNHRAEDDIKESIDEARLYKDRCFGIRS